MCSRLIVRRCPDGLVYFLANVSAKKPPLHLVSSCCLRLDAGRTSRAEIPLGRCVSSDRSPQTHLFYPRTQIGRLHSQKLGRSINTFDFPAGLLEDSKNVLALPTSHFCFGWVFR